MTAERHVWVSLYPGSHWIQVLTERLLVETARNLDLEAVWIVAQAESEVPAASGRTTWSLVLGQCPTVLEGGRKADRLDGPSRQKASSLTQSQVEK